MKKHLFSLLVAFIATMGFTSCEEPVEKLGKFTGYEEAKLVQSFSNEASSTGSFTFTADCDWSAVVEAVVETKTEWLTLDKTSGAEGEVTIKFILTANTIGIERNANIAITCGTEGVINVGITQNPVYLSDYEESSLIQAVPYNVGYMKPFEFKANDDWTLTSDSNWVIFRNGDTDDAIAITGGKRGDAQFCLFLLENNTVADRDAIVILTCGDTKLEIHVKQKTNPGKLIGYDKTKLKQTISFNAQEVRFAFNSRDNWTAKSDKTWAVVKVKEGPKGAAEVVIEIEENEGLERDAKVVIACGAEKITIDLKQERLGAFHKYLLEQYDTDKDGYFSEEEVNAVTEIDCSGQNLPNLKGLEYFQKLLKLDCSNNNLTSIKEIASVFGLKTLYCYGNKIVEVDFRQNSQLEFFDGAPMETFTLLHVSSHLHFILGVCGTAGPSDAIDNVRNPEFLPAQVVVKYPGELN